MTDRPEPGPGAMNQEIFSIVADDVVSGLGPMFGSRLSGSSVAVHPDFAEEELIGNDDLAVVPWIYYCRHDGDFQGMVRTERDVDIHGVTFVDNRGDETVLHRLVDWTGVLTQVGVEVSWRVPVNEEQYIANRRRLREEDERAARERAEARASYRTRAGAEESEGT
jgi:hypothetical protein